MKEVEGKRVNEKWQERKFLQKNCVDVILLIFEEIYEDYRKVQGMKLEVNFLQSLLSYFQIN